MTTKKLGKRIEGSEIIITIGEEELRFDTNLLSEETKGRLVPFGCGHKLGDSAASSKTPEASKLAINRVWEGLLEGKWSTRVPAEEGAEKAPKISKKTIAANFANLPPEQQESARTLLASMGIVLD